MYQVLPCNGLDKAAGCVAREAALILQEAGCRLICPVLCSTSRGARYAGGEWPLLVIDGCTMRCASKLAAKRGLHVDKRLNVADEARERGLSLCPSLRLGAAEIALANDLAAKVR